MKLKPTGFIARCQCGKIIGAIDWNRTENVRAGRIMGEWIADGCTVEPRFGDKWEIILELCECTVPPEAPKEGE